MFSIEGENMRGVTWVTIAELKSGDWRIGGRPLATDHVRATAAGKADWSEAGHTTRPYLSAIRQPNIRLLAYVRV
jgi:hypothetical protein